MATITALHVYPVKSCRGIAAERAVLGPAGLEVFGVGDREWMVVDAKRRFLTQREEPGLARIVPRISASYCSLAAPGVEPLELELDARTASCVEVAIWESAVTALDCGEAPAAWISRVLRREARLVRFDPAWRRESDRRVTAGLLALNRFSDGFPLLVLGNASLQDLNRRLVEAGRGQLPMDRFRPNIVLEGLEPYEEDFVARWSAGPVVLRPVKPCPRCAIPSIDQASGEPGLDPRDILAGYRLHAKHGIVLGQNAVTESGIGAELRVGQVLAEDWTF
ncbi:MAG: MOSC domain-containing protein [Betaproteobacteria bacterium]|nr:MOSC domain-containing protein [Betaproteobacteria bacterium]